MGSSFLLALFLRKRAFKLLSLHSLDSNKLVNPSNTYQQVHQCLHTHTRGLLPYLTTLCQHQHPHYHHRYQACKSLPSVKLLLLLEYIAPRNLLLQTYKLQKKNRSINLRKLIILVLIIKTCKLLEELATTRSYYP